MKLRRSMAVVPWVVLMVTIFATHSDALSTAPRDTTTENAGSAAEGSLAEEAVLRFVGSPRVEGYGVTVELNITGDFESIQCNLSTRRRHKMTTDCSSGSFQYTRLRDKGVYTLTVVGALANGTVKTISNTFRSDGYVCWVHSIGDGVVVSGKSITLEFEGTGRGADDDGLQHECVLRGPQNQFIRNCVSPVSFSGLLPGQYKLRIRRVDTMNNCLKNKWKAFSFTIQE